MGCKRRCLQLLVVVDELLFGTQPSFNVVAILTAARFVKAVGELGDLFVCWRRFTASILSHTPWAQVGSPEIANTLVVSAATMRAVPVMTSDLLVCRFVCIRL